MDDPDRPSRAAPPASVPFYLDAADRPQRPQPPPNLTTSASFGDSEKNAPYSPAPSDDVTLPILPAAAGVRFDTPKPLPQPPSQPGPSFHPHHHQNGSSNQNNGGGGGGASDMRRKKSLVRPDRAPVDPSHRLFNYRNHAAAMEADERGRTGLSTTGAAAVDGSAAQRYDGYASPPPTTAAPLHPGFAALGRPSDGPGLRRGKSVLARTPGEADESGLAILKRGETLRRQHSQSTGGRRRKKQGPVYDGAGSEAGNPSGAKKPWSPWMFYCRAVTICVPSFLLGCCGIKTPERERAWREKIGMLVIITLLMAVVAFQTFAFTDALCGTPSISYRTGRVEAGMMIFHGKAYDLDSFQHVGAPGIGQGDNPLYDLFNASSKDGSFLFQNVNQHCKGLITAARGTGITTDSSGNLGWYFPCNMYDQFGTSAVNKTGYAEGTYCHTQSGAREAFKALKVLGDVTYTWSDLQNSSRNLAIFDGNILDLNLLNWLDKSQVSYPDIFDTLKVLDNSYSRQDLTMTLVREGGKQLGECLVDTIKIGVIGTDSFGCLLSTVVLYVSLVVILAVVVIKWAMAVSFAWFFSWRLGTFGNETPEQRAARRNEIENWSSDIYRPAPARYRPNAAKYAKKGVLPTKSRFTPAGASPANGSLRPPSLFEMRKASGTPPGARSPLGAGSGGSPPGSPVRASASQASLAGTGMSRGGAFSYPHSRRSSQSGEGLMGSCPFPLYNVVPQPPPDYEPFNFPLIHTLLLVTAYSESVEGLRTTLDSLATTDYPNSHKVILVIADGMVKGSGNDMTTPEICLSMMKELVVPAAECEALPYVAIADGHKQYNRAKVYAGFYSYDDNTVEANKQQRVPMVLVAKAGNPMEADEPKAGNRGKRDSQVLLMAFLQKVMFDERMTAFEYEFFNSLWRCTGVSPDHYEVALMVDADTKVFPDSVSRMVCCMVRDPEIMGLCGETKIANKSDSWVTKIQVFEYYISHHQTKAFESMFGGVTCLPGCFSMYRIKAPKGPDGYWVPILANPDIVEHYSENIVDTLHAKNLLLLGEDRFLTTLMLKTFPKRKMMFCPQAVCKTIVPDVFRVLLSQRRRWINSTIHNLFELLFVNDLCGTFCFSMQFIIGMELVGTLVLPAAIAFTLYILAITIIPGHTKPITSLILLALILGLPGILIVITSRKWVYVWWMLIYLGSLPIWNFVLPMYAYLHMDDFTWGATRQVAGGKEKAHGDKEGEFDSSNIVMKRWAEFERERRWRSGTHSRDSAYDPAGGRSASQHRYSINSSVETWSAPPSDPFSNRHGVDSEGGSARGAPYRSRDQSVQELSLPQPLAREGSPSARPVLAHLPPAPGGVGGGGGGGYPEAPARDGLLLNMVQREARYGPTHAAAEWVPGPGAGMLQDSPASARPPVEPGPRFAPAGGAAMLPQPPEFVAHPRPEAERALRGAATAAAAAAAAATGGREPRSAERGEAGARHRPGSQARGVSLTDGGAVPDARGGYRQVDRSRRPSSGTNPGHRLSRAQGHGRPQVGQEGDAAPSAPVRSAVGLPPPPVPPPSTASASRQPGGWLPPGAAPARSPTNAAGR